MEPNAYGNETKFVKIYKVFIIKFWYILSMILEFVT
jgi:hypothetical protein